MLTTQQRDVLHLLLTVDAPLAAIEIGERVELNQRQVHYSLRAVKDWLARHNVALQNIPGVGAQVRCTPAQRQQLLADLRLNARFQLVLSADQRQQLVAFSLLTAVEPLVIQQLQDSMAISRSTAMKDMDAVAPWLARFGLELVRRQHAGSWLQGPELAIRQALAALLWGDVPSDRPIFATDHGRGLSCALLADAGLLPALGPLQAMVAACDVSAAVDVVSRAEADLGWQFSDDSVLYLGLALTVQARRIEAGRYVLVDDETAGWLRGQPAWRAAAGLVARQGLPDAALQGEVAAAAILLLACPHEGGAIDPGLHSLIAASLDLIAGAYGMPALCDDAALRGGIESQLSTAAICGRFGVWLPPRSPDDLPAVEGEVEGRLTDQIDALFYAQTGLRLSERHRHSLTLLLHAAQTRARPARERRVLVVCPSGMATTQLLVARLRSRFPGHGSYQVIPLRQLGPEQIAAADLIITTIPLELAGPTPVIRVHPALTPADIAALDPWMD